MTDLAEQAIWHVARDLARMKSANAYDWHNRTIEKQGEATSKINTMTNIELLKLIGEVIYDD